MNTIATRVIFIFMILASFSCSEDDSVRVPDLTGAWTLGNVTGGILDINIEFTSSEVVWNFDTVKGEVFIQNSVPETDGRMAYAGLPTGKYSYQLKKLQDNLLLYINETRVGFIKVEENTLLIDTGISLEGFLTRYRKL